LDKTEAHASRLFDAREGAEARIELVRWLGKPAIRKIRVPKVYRSPELDRLLRTKRARQEAELLHLAKVAGVHCPFVFFVDPDRSEIIMEYVEGLLLKQLTDEADRTAPRELVPKNDAEISGRFELLGAYAARLHSRRIIHGDLTTKNVLVKGERMALIDFGLAFISDRLEDRAEDVHLLMQAIRSTCSSRLVPVLIESVLRGYRSIAGGDSSTALERQMREIEKRGRYARVE
jgi:TP53 regulating kinase-like protein